MTISLRDAGSCGGRASRASTSMLQTRLGIGYQRAARIIEEMEERGNYRSAERS